MPEKYILKEITEEKDWQILSLQKGAHFTESFFYGKWQESVGRIVKRFAVYEDSLPVCFFQIIFYPLLESKKYGYIPYGPVAKRWTEPLLIFLKEKINEIVKKESLAFLRLDFTPNLSGETSGKLFKKSPAFSYSGSVFQPRYEWILEVDKTSENLLDSMHQNAQYGIRLAEKKGVKVEIVTKNIVKYLKDFNVLMEATSGRKGFTTHNKDYYEKFFQLAEKNENIFLGVASLGDEILSINVYVIHGNTVLHLFGNSSNLHRGLQAPYLAMWKSILYAKERGVKYYNFGGISDPAGKMYPSLRNLTYFKQKFGGAMLTHSDFYDCLGSSFWYYLYKLRKYIKSK